MKKREVNKIIEDKREQALKSLWPDDEVNVNHLTFRFTGDLHDYQSLKVHIENVFTGDWYDFKVDDVSPYLRGKLIKEYYAREIPLPKEMLGGM